MRNDSSDQLISIKVSGSELQKSEGYNLRHVLDSLSSLEELVDKTYLYTQNKSRMSNSDRENISIRLNEIKEGSFVAELVIQMKDFILPIAPLIAENPTQIWKAIKDSYTFIKEFLTAKEEGNDVTINLDNNHEGVQVVNSGSGNVEINVHSAIPALAERISPVLHNLANKIDGDDVSSIAFMENQEISMDFSEEEKRLFKKRTYLEEEYITLIGKITNPNFYGLSGQIQIYENEEYVPPGVYRFTAKKDNMNDEELWKEIYLVDKSYVCQKRVSFSTSQGFKEVVEELILINVISE